MKELPPIVSDIADLPNCAALYALYGGTRKRAFVAYVGVADSLKRRVAQHLLNRDSSVATGTAAVGINPDYVTEIRWWEHQTFAKRVTLEAAEMVAFDILNPALRSRRPFTKVAMKLYRQKRFRNGITSLLRTPSGQLFLPSLVDVARQLAMLEKRVANIEGRRDLPLKQKAKATN